MDEQEFNCILNTEETEVMPLVGIPVEDDNPIHDGINPCGDLECPCATYGYSDEVQG